MRPELIVIVATDLQNGIGIQNQLPWHLPEDLKHFKATTSGYPIIMGRKTWESIGKPLPNRTNIVVTQNPAWENAHRDKLIITHSVEDALHKLDALKQEKAFIIGGAQIYQLALPLADKIIRTEIQSTFTCDAYFPAIDTALWLETAREKYRAENGLRYHIVHYQKK